MVYNLEKEHKKSSLMCKKKEELAKEIMRLEHNVNVMNERLNVQANAINHYENEARNKAIEEFVYTLCERCMRKDNSCYETECPFCTDFGCDIIKIAESMKGGK